MILCAGSSLTLEPSLTSAQSQGCHQSSSGPASGVRRQVYSLLQTREPTLLSLKPCRSKKGGGKDEGGEEEEDDDEE